MILQEVEIWFLLNYIYLLEIQELHMNIHILEDSRCIKNPQISTKDVDQEQQTMTFNR